MMDVKCDDRNDKHNIDQKGVTKHDSVIDGIGNDLYSIDKSSSSDKVTQGPIVSNRNTIKGYTRRRKEHS